MVAGAVGAVVAGAAGAVAAAAAPLAGVSLDGAGCSAWHAMMKTGQTTARNLRTLIVDDGTLCRARSAVKVRRSGDSADLKNKIPSIIVRAQSSGTDVTYVAVVLDGKKIKEKIDDVPIEIDPAERDFTVAPGERDRVVVVDVAAARRWAHHVLGGWDQPIATVKRSLRAAPLLGANLYGRHLLTRYRSPDGVLA